MTLSVSGSPEVQMQLDIAVIKSTLATLVTNVQNLSDRITGNGRAGIEERLKETEIVSTNALKLAEENTRALTELRMVVEASIREAASAKEVVELCAAGRMTEERVKKVADEQVKEKLRVPLKVIVPVIVFCTAIVISLGLLLAIHFDPAIVRVLAPFMAVPIP